MLISQDTMPRSIPCLKNEERLRWEQLSAENEQLINWCAEKLKIHLCLKKAEAERKELEAAKQRELTISKLKNDFPRVKELGNSMKDKTFVFKSIYLGQFGMQSQLCLQLELEMFKKMTATKHL